MLTPIRNIVSTEKYDVRVTQLTKIKRNTENVVYKQKMLIVIFDVGFADTFGIYSIDGKHDLVQFISMMYM